MSLYATFFTYSAATWQRMVALPEDRTAVVGATFEAVGGRLDALYYMLGPHDGLVIVEVPDAVAAAAVSALVAASGAYSHVETHALLTPADLVTALGRAGEAATRYTTPGGAT